METNSKRFHSNGFSAKKLLWIMAVLLLGLLLFASAFDWFGITPDQNSLEKWVISAGAWGPIAIVGLMMLAVVVSPIPSAPIAIASGAAYGHYLGAAYVAIGSELGAITAFLIARQLGRDALMRLLGEKADYGLLGSQNALAITVFVSRLFPFVSFDAMSYAAGLSRIHFWRFGLATLAGIIPASFLLAHVGSVAIDGNVGYAEWVALGLGLVVAIPVLLTALFRGRSH